MNIKYCNPIYLSVIALLFAACSSKDDTESPAENNTGRAVVVKAEAAALQENQGLSENSIGWTSADSIYLAYANSGYRLEPFALTSGQGNSATFTYNNSVIPDGTSVYAVSPYRYYDATLCRFDISKQEGTLKDLHKYDCKIAKGTVNAAQANLTFQRQIAILHLKNMDFGSDIEATNVANMTLTGDNVGTRRQWSSLTGDSLLTENDTIKVSNSIPLEGTKLNDSYLAIFPGTTKQGDNYKLKVTLDDGRIYNVTWKADTTYTANNEYTIEPKVQYTYNLYPYKKAYKITIPSLEDFNKSWIYSVYDGSQKIAEICLEFLHADPYSTRAIVVYPVGELDGGAADYTNGYVAKIIDTADDHFKMSINTGNISGGSLKFDYSTYKATYQSGKKAAVNTVYLNKFGVTDQEIAGAVDLTPKPYTVTDASGNEYGILKIGIDVWMQSNLRTTKMTDGNDITIANSTSSYNGNFNYAFYWNMDQSTVKERGLMYGVGLLDNISVKDPDSRNTWAISTGVKSLRPASYDTNWSHMFAYLGYYINAILDPNTTTWNGATNTDNYSGFLVYPSGMIGYYRVNGVVCYYNNYHNILTYYWMKATDGSYCYMRFCYNWNCYDFPATSYQNYSSFYVPIRMVRTDNRNK
jgi:hypothetical protein